MPDGSNQPTRGRLLLAGLIVGLTLIATWKVVDYRTQPPPPPAFASAR